MFRRRRQRRTPGLSFNRMIPNILTLLALSAGLTSIQFGLNGRWEHAVVAIVVAAVFDALDGRIARMLKGTSKFGAELDSLSDFVSFGVAPGMLLYLWSLNEAGRYGWVLVLLYAVCCALRLARFNTDLEQPERPPWAYNFFTGVPSPAGAGLVLLPMMLTFQFGPGFFDRPPVVAVVMVAVAGLLVSRLPTFSFKKFKVEHKYVLPTMLFVGLLAAMIVAAPFLTLSVILIAYIVSFPFGLRSYRRLEREAERMAEGAPGTPEASPDDTDTGAPPPV